MTDKAEAANHLYLVDGSAFIFRAYHRLPPLTNPEGTPVGAVYGYTTMLWKLAEDLDKAQGPTHLAVILDKSGRSFRNDIYPEYKANRPPAPEDLVPQFPLIRDATRAFSLPCIEEQGLEADDIIASYARAAAREGWNVTIVSSDKDLMQLIEEGEKTHPDPQSSTHPNAQSPTEATTGANTGANTGASTGANTGASTGANTETNTGTSQYSGRIDMLDTMKNLRISTEEVKEKFGVGPELVGDVLALMGDSVDNIPGIYGVGPKTATKLIQEHGNLTAALDSAENMKKSKLKERLIEHRKDAELSRILVTLKEDCDLPVALDDLKLDGVPNAPLEEFLTQHGFSSLLRRLDSGRGSPDRPTNLNPAKRVNKGAISGGGRANGGAGGVGGVGGVGERNGNLTAAGEGDSGNGAIIGNHQPPEEMPQIDRSLYECVQDKQALTRWVDKCLAARVIAVDTETSALDAMQADLVGISLSTGPGEACYIPLDHGGTDLLTQRPEQLDREEALALLRALLVNPAVLKIGQNIKYDCNVLARYETPITPIDDTMLISFAMDAGRGAGGIGGGHGMDELSERHLGHTPISFKEVCGTGKSQIRFNEVDLLRATEYAAEDAEVTWRLHRLLKPQMIEEGGGPIYERVDRPLVPVVAAMERRGISVDRARLSKLSEEFAQAMARLETEIHAQAGREFTIGSPKQLGEILFDELGFKGKRRGKSGQYSTDSSVLEKLSAEGAKIADNVLEWRHMAKLKSTYTDALQAAINPKTQRVHTSYSLVGAQTGRLSSTEPNLQNIPIRTEIGRQIREAFVAKPGHILLAADYSQIELRLAACMADVPALKEAFAKGEDIHARTASEMYGEVTRDTRAQAKTINFAILYGISRWGLAGRLGVEADEAQAVITRYFDRFPGIQRYIAETLQSVRDKGYSETLFGRKTWFPRINSKNQAERQGSERAAINAPIQGTSADIIKRAMVRMEAALAEENLENVQMLLQVHDELVFELPEGDVEKAKPVIERVMAEAAQPAVTLDVPLAVEIGTGVSWGAAH